MIPRKLFLIAILLSITGCSGTSDLGANAVQSNKPAQSSKSWHELCGWKAEDYFTDPQVIALCHAIEADDLKEIDRLVADGADVNATGKGMMTPLLWAFPDNKLERFKRMLEHGADPNVVVESDFSTKGYIHPGHSVTHLAGGTKFPDYFKQVIQHGADIELLDTHMNETLLHVIIKAGVSEKKERIQLLLDRKIDLDHVSNRDQTATMSAVSWGGQYEIALMLLEAGADPGVYCKLSNQKLVHFVVREERRIRNPFAKARADYLAIVQRLKDHGESLDDARKDLDRWVKWGQIYPSKKIKMLREKEIAERLERQKAEAEKKKGD